MKIQIRQPQCFSEIGMKDNQEDYLWPQTADVTNRIFVLCDGVGGQDAGEVASKTTATAIGEYLTTHAPSTDVFTPELFAEAVEEAYNILDAVDTTDTQHKMGTTMTCVVLHRSGAMLAHIGDSRIYQVRPSNVDKTLNRYGIVYQTEDHSLVNDLLKADLLKPEDIESFPQKHVITRAIQPNTGSRKKADIYNIVDVQAGDYFFMCCDGVLEQVKNSDLGYILADQTKDDSAKLNTIKALCDNRTRDNYTCWLIPIDTVESEPSDVLLQNNFDEGGEIEVDNAPLPSSIPGASPVDGGVVVLGAESTNSSADDSVTVYPTSRRSASRRKSNSARRSSKKNNNKLPLIYIIAGIVAIFLLGFSFFSSSKKETKEENETTVEENSVESQVESSSNTEGIFSKPSTRKNKTTTIIIKSEEKSSAPVSSKKTKAKTSNSPQKKKKTETKSNDATNGNPKPDATSGLVGKKNRNNQSSAESAGPQPEYRTQKTDKAKSKFNSVLQKQKQFN